MQVYSGYSSQRGTFVQSVYPFPSRFAERKWSLHGFWDFVAIICSTALQLIRSPIEAPFHAYNIYWVANPGTVLTSPLTVCLWASSHNSYYCEGDPVTDRGSLQCPALRIWGSLLDLESPSSLLPLDGPTWNSKFCLTAGREASGQQTNSEM